MKINDLIENHDEVADVDTLLRDRGWTINQLWADNNKYTLDLRGRNLKSLKGCPSSVLGSVWANNNYLTSLEGIPKAIGVTLFIQNNPIVNLHNVHKSIKHVKNIHLSSERIKSHILGLLLINELLEVYRETVPLQRWLEIVNQYLPNNQGMKAVYDCQTELLEADLDEYAQL